MPWRGRRRVLQQFKSTETDKSAGDTPWVLVFVVLVSSPFSLCSSCRSVLGFWTPQFYCGETPMSIVADAEDEDWQASLQTLLACFFVQSWVTFSKRGGVSLVGEDAPKN